MFRFQDLAIRPPDTRHLKPLYITNVLAAPQGPLFCERRLGKSLGPYHHNCLSKN